MKNKNDSINSNDDCKSIYKNTDIIPVITYTNADRDKLIKTLDNIKKTSIWFNIPKNTIGDYIKSGKLYKNKFYFCVKQYVNSKTYSYNKD